MLAGATTIFPAIVAQLIFMGAWSQKTAAGTDSELALPDTESLGEAPTPAEPELPG